MADPWRKLAFLTALLVGGCSGGSSGRGGAGETDGDTDSATGGADDGNDDGNDDGGVDDGSPCHVDADCDDNNPCSVDACEQDVCVLVGTETRDCRPQINIEYPPRGATIKGAPGEDVRVTGHVSTGHGRIDALTLNGQTVEVDDDGAFALDVAPTVGGNTLLFETTDSNDFIRSRVQSFLWSTEFNKPDEPVMGAAPQGLMVYLDQQAIDDGDHSMPADDLATLMQIAVDNFDIGQFIDTTTPIVEQSGYEVYLTDMEFDAIALSLESIDGGVQLRASVNGILGDLFYDCVGTVCLLAGGDSTGGLSINGVGVQADLLINVSPDHEVDIDLLHVQTMIDPDDVNVWSDNSWTNFLLAIVEYFIADDLTAQIADELNSQIYGSLSPLLNESLAGLNFSTTLDFPSLQDPGSTISVDLITDWGDTDFRNGSGDEAQGGVVYLRGGGYGDGTPPYDNLGIPARAGCGTGEALDLPRSADLEIGLADDLLNQLLYGAWRGGLLQFPLPQSEDGDGAIFSDLEVDISGLLAPTANDCVDGRLLAHIGDLRIDAGLKLQGKQIDFVAFTTMVVQVDISVVDGEITIAIPGVEWMQTDLTVEQDDAIEFEETLITAVEVQLEEQLLGALSGGGFGGISLPQMDLSETLGLPPGTAEISIGVDGVTHTNGVTVISGHL